MQRFQQLFTRGFFVLVPIVVVTVFLGQVFKQTSWIVELFDEFFPDSDLATFLISNGIALLLMVAVVTFLGFMAETGIMNQMAGRFDRSFRRYVPGYLQVQNSVRAYFSSEPWYTQFDVVTVERAGGREFGFEVRRSDQSVMVFLPNSSTGRDGNLVSFPSDLVAKADISPSEFLGLLAVSTQTKTEASNKERK